MDRDFVEGRGKEERKKNGGRVGVGGGQKSAPAARKN